MDTYWNAVQDAIDADIYDEEVLAELEADFYADHEESGCSLCDETDVHEHDPDEYGSFDDSSDWFSLRFLR